jgi:hypothetical protein
MSRTGMPCLGAVYQYATLMASIPQWRHEKIRFLGEGASIPGDATLAARFRPARWQGFAGSA